MLSIVIITCNRKNSLVKTIESCAEHVGMEWELIIVDNGSNDGTQEAVKALCNTRKIELKYYYSEINLGVAGARNLGYKKASGDVLYFIDDDAYIISEGNCLDNAYQYLKNNVDTLALSTKIWDELWDGILPEITANGCEMCDGVQLRSFIGCSHFLKKDKILTDSIYPDNLFYGGEEIFLSYRIYKAGKAVEYYEGVFVEHHPSKKTRASKYEIYRNRIINWYIVKRYYYPQPFLFVSYICFVYRILKLSKGSMKKIVEINKIKKERYDIQYKDSFSYGDMIRIIKKFGYRYLV